MGAPSRADDLVGRLGEQTSLVGWLDEASAGAPRIVVVSGPPGMGKTRLLRWLVEHARSAGCTAAWGAALEDVDVPFLAAGALLAGVPGGAEAMAADRSTSVWGSAPTPVLIDAVAAVQREARRHPVVFVLDDIQWADEATLAFLQQLAVVASTSVDPLPLLLAVTVRDGDGNEPGRRAARRLLREPGARRLAVGPLDEVEVREMHHRLTGTYPTAVELRRLIEVTAGCPLFIRARLSAPTSPDTAIDHGIDLLEDRFTSLPRATRRAVEVLAVLGARAPHPALEPLLGPGHERLLAPAVEAELLADDSGADDTGAMVFEHSLYRHAVLQSMAPERVDTVAADVARRVASEPLRSLLSPAVVAAHLRAIPDAVPDDVAAPILWAAGEEAYDAGAWGRAGEHFGAALAAAERGDVCWSDRARRWYCTGEAAFRDHDPSCADHLQRAVELAEADDDLDVVAMSSILRARALLTLAPGRSASGVDAELVALAGHDEPRLDRWRAALLGMAAECRFATFDVETGSALAARARQAASLSDDPLSTWAIEIGEGLQHVAALRLDDAESCFARAIDSSVRAGSSWHETSSRHRTALVELIRGNVAAAERTTGRAMEIARECHHWAECSFGGALRTICAATHDEGRLELEAEAAAAMYRRTSYVFSPILLFPALAYARAIRGDLDGAADALDAVEAAHQPVGSHRRSLARVRRWFEGPDDLPRRRGRSRSHILDLASLAGLGAAAEDAIEDGDTALMEVAATELDEIAEWGVVLAPGWPHFFPRIRAAIAVAQGERDAGDRVDAARRHAEAEDMHVELVMLDLLASRAANDPANAAEWAASALQRADACGLLAAVVLSQDRLRQLGVEPGRPMLRAVLNTDIVSSTDLTRSLGDERWLRVLDQHDELVRSTVRRHGGVVFKHTGDGMYAWFASASDAVDATRVLLGAFEDGPQHDHPLRIRAGVALGSPLSRDDGDLFGITVIEASRLCSAAAPGSGLASGAVAAAFGGALAPRGRIEMKGFDEPVETYLLEPVGPGQRL